SGFISISSGCRGRPRSAAWLAQVPWAADHDFVGGQRADLSLDDAAVLVLARGGAVVPPARAQRALLDQREPAASLLTVDHGADVGGVALTAGSLRCATPRGQGGRLPLSVRVQSARCPSPASPAVARRHRSAPQWSTGPSAVGAHRASVREGRASASCGERTA